MKGWLLFLILGFALFNGTQAALTSTQVETAMTITRYTPYCNDCWFCYLVNDTKIGVTVAAKDVSYTTQLYNSKTAIALTIKPQYTTSKDGTEFCYNWHRDRPDVIDIIPTVLGIQITKYATWSPTSFSIITPAAGGIQGTIWVNVTFLDSNKGGLFWWNGEQTRNKHEDGDVWRQLLFIRQPVIRLF